jgi:hypothetical protein
VGAWGGFGGGASGACNGGGGGGGYSGGGNGGGGAGSFSLVPKDNLGFNNGHGYVKITKKGDASITNFEGSTIIAAKHQVAICNLLPNKSFTLLYRASRDGFTAAAFHSRCNGQAPLWIVIKSNTGFIATAYTSVAFNRTNGFVSAASGSCWLNNLEDNNGRLSTLKALNTTHPQYSIYDNANYGPTFGAGADLHIPDKCNSNKGYTTTPYSYAGLKNTTLFGNADNWTVTDMEIYLIK